MKGTLKGCSQMEKKNQTDFDYLVARHGSESAAAAYLEEKARQAAVSEAEHSRVMSKRRWEWILGNVPTSATAPAPQPVPAAGTTDWFKKKWTQEQIAKLQAYRGQHTEKETAEHFNISGVRIRQLLAPSKTAAGPFTGLIHRTK